MRRERDWSAVQAHEHLHDGLGLAPKSKASYTALEDGKAPTPKQEAFLRSYFDGGPTVEDADPASVEGSGLASSAPDLSALIQSIGELVAEIRAARRERSDLEERVMALELAARLRGSSGGGADAEPAARRQLVG